MRGDGRVLAGEHLGAGLSPLVQHFLKHVCRDSGSLLLLLCYSGPDPAPPTTLSRVAPTPHITRPKVTYSVQDLNQWNG